tara:strand:+ start:11145 stop:12344 length:1200 start_codon:yes stop_codon:yes gene_type:complete
MNELKRIDLLEVVTVFAKRKRTLVIIVFLATMMGAITAFIWPKSYQSEMTFIVTDGSGINFSSGGLLSGLANLSVGGSKITSDQALILIRSTVIQDEVIDKFNLKDVFGTDVPEALRKNLDQKLIIDEKREGGLGFNSIIAITISYVDESPQRSYDIISYYYNLLDSTVTDLNRKGVGDGYYMLKTRLEQNEIELEIAEDSLVSFQKRYGILEVEEQAKSQIKTLAELKTEIVKLEVQIGYTKEAFGSGNNKIEDLEVQKKQFERKYNELLTGKKTSIDGSFDVFQSVQEMPELFLEYLRRYREVIIQEEIYKVLYPQFEQQKLSYEEANSGLRVVDPAIVPTYKSAPKRAYIILAAMLFGGFVGILTVLFKEWKESLRANNPEELNRFEEFIKELKKF